jgi:hypothetical protein
MADVIVLMAWMVAALVFAGGLAGACASDDNDEY